MLLVDVFNRSVVKYCEAGNIAILLTLQSFLLIATSPLDLVLDCGLFDSQLRDLLFGNDTQ